MSHTYNNNNFKNNTNNRTQVLQTTIFVLLLFYYQRLKYLINYSVKNYFQKQITNIIINSFNI